MPKHDILAMADAVAFLPFKIKADGSEAVGELGGRKYTVRQPRKNRFILTADDFPEVALSGARDVRMILHMVANRVPRA